jgi:hypothetical protein
VASFFSVWKALSTWVSVISISAFIGPEPP